MKSNQFKRLVKEKKEIIAFSELQQKQRKGEKGRNIIYRSLSMADYLLPEDSGREEKNALLETRNE